MHDKTIVRKSFTNSQIDTQPTGDFEGYVAVYDNTDRHNDIIRPGAFGDSINSKKLNSEIKFLWQHDHTKPLGEILELREDNHGLWARGKIYPAIALPNTSLSDLVSFMKSGVLNSFSVGFSIEEYNYDDEDRRIIIKGDLLEFSLVTIPANPQATLISVKDMNGVEAAFKDYPIADENYAWDKTEALIRWRKFTKSDESPSEEYKKGFLAIEGDESKFASYHLQIVDVIDNIPHIVPKALDKASRVISGNTLAKLISPQKNEEVKSFLSSIYKKIGKDLSGNDAVKFLRNAKSITERDKILKKFFNLSNSQLSAIRENEKRLFGVGNTIEIVTRVAKEVGFTDEQIDLIKKSLDINNKALSPAIEAELNPATQDISPSDTTQTEDLHHSATQTMDPSMIQVAHTEQAKHIVQEYLDALAK